MRMMRGMMMRGTCVTIESITSHDECEGLEAGLCG